MAGKGPPKTPSKVLEMRGSWRAKTRTGEPKPASNALTCPAYLDDDGKKLWRTLTRQLKGMGIIGSVDAQALGRYCQLHTRWLAAEAEIKKSGSIAPTLNADGEVTGWRVAAAVKIAGDLADKLLRLEMNYGMTASARASLSVAPDKKSSAGDGTADKARFFKKRA